MSLGSFTLTLFKIKTQTLINTPSFLLYSVLERSCVTDYIEKINNLAEQLEDRDPVVDELSLDTAFAVYRNQILPE